MYFPVFKFPSKTFNMKFTMSWFTIPIEILLFVSSAAASTPLAAHVVRDLDVLEMPQMRGFEFPPLHHLSKRSTSQNLGSLSLATQLSNEVLFSM